MKHVYHIVMSVCLALCATLYASPITEACLHASGGAQSKGHGSNRPIRPRSYSLMARDKAHPLRRLLLCRPAQVDRVDPPDPRAPAGMRQPRLSSSQRSTSGRASSENPDFYARRARVDEPPNQTGGDASDSTRGARSGRPLSVQPIQASGVEALTTLSKWMESNGFAALPEEGLKYYLERSWTFLAIKVDPSKDVETSAQRANLSE